MAEEKWSVHGYRTGANKETMVIRFPVGMTSAIPEGNHDFEATFTDWGINLTYIGPASGRRHKATKPAWAK